MSKVTPVMSAQLFAFFTTCPWANSDPLPCTIRDVFLLQIKVVKQNGSLKKEVYELAMKFCKQVCCFVLDLIAALNV